MDHETKRNETGTTRLLYNMHDVRPKQYQNIRSDERKRVRMSDTSNTSTDMTTQLKHRDAT